VRRERGSRPWHLYLLALVAVAAAALAIVEIGPPSSSARTAREIVSAQDGVVQSTVTGSGNVEPGTDVNVNFKTSGTLQAVYVSVGQHVNQGQLLAQLNRTSAQLALDQADQNLTAAQDQLTSLESGSSASSSASSTGTSTTTSYTGHQGSTEYVSDTTLTSTTPTTTPSPASIASAQASVYGAEASVQNAQQALNDTKLYAPTSGTIASLESLVSGDSVSAGSTSSASSSGSSSSSSTGAGAGAAGGTATAGSLGGSGSSSSSNTPFAEIVNTGTMSMTVAFSESDTSKVKVGQPATVTPDAVPGVELGAHVTQIATVGTSSNGVVSYNATLTLDQSDSRVKPGMSASAAVIVGQAQGVSVPNAAVSGTGTIGTVNLLESGKTVQQQVVVGLRGDSRTQIISGVNAGQQLVVTVVLPPLNSSTTSTTGSNGTLGGGGLGGGGLGGGGFRGGGGGFLGGGGGFRGGG
jgi:multidrug efflux pump subunit AcrA (membrane-fusion protein)